MSLESPTHLPPYSHLDPYLKHMQRYRALRPEGRVTHMIGHLLEATNPGCSKGSMCYVFDPQTQVSVPAEVVGFREDKILVMLLEQMNNVGPQCRILYNHRDPMVRVGEGLLGRVLDPLMRPIDGQGELFTHTETPLYPPSINPLNRPRVFEPLDVGVRVLNGVLTCGRGQRIGILAGSGVGKSVLLGMMARFTNADVNVIALIGERGREVKDFIEGILGPGGMARSVVVVATSDQPALLRMRGAYVATSIAEFFRAQGMDVLLTMDSLTRFAMAQREIGLAAGEPPTTKGYPPSVFATMPGLLERAGTSGEKGSITGFYTVLIEGDDTNDPIGDAARAIVDGHIVLNRDIAAKGTYPAVDLLVSASRVMPDVTSDVHQQLAQIYRSTLATYREAEDLINIGAYVRGSNPDIDYAVQKYPLMMEFARQGMSENTNLQDSVQRLQQIFGDRLQPR
jgi:flagellum-specific ATP synthase